MTGLLCLDKPEGISSFGSVSKVRGITRERKAGHTGTLDPMATGVLPVLLGDATRFLSYLPDSDKAYRAGFLLGKTTDTLDITGTVTGEYPVTVGRAEIESLLPRFTGKIQQLPPMFSAKSVDGKRLYELARQGIEVERKPCEVEIKRLALLNGENGEFILEVHCSKGTYIRSLIDDIGRALGCGAVMTALRRTQAMGFTLEDCITLDTLQEMKDSGADFSQVVIGLDRLLKDFEKITVSEAQSVRFKNGGALDTDRLKIQPAAGVPVCVYAPDGALLGLGENSGTQLKALRLMPRQEDK